MSVTECSGADLTHQNHGKTADPYITKRHLERTAFYKITWTW